MKTAAVVAARIDAGPDGLPWSPDYGDVYHPRSGALEQARRVFLGGNELPARWAGRERFVILETGFGLGNSFLATWAAWRADAQRCDRLHFVSIEAHPPTRETLATLARDPELHALAAELAEAWPPLTCNLHRLDFDAGRVQLSLCLGDVAAWLPELVASVDAFYLDGFAPARNPQMWQPRLFKALGRLAAPSATAATWSAARSVRDSLTSAGFEVTKAAGAGGKRDITLARYAPRFTPRRAPARAAAPVPGERHALVIGGGLAGCATAWALAQQGWSSSVFDRHAEPAQEASGNPGGLFHGIVNAQDGAHARFNRAAALLLRRVAGDLLDLADSHRDTSGLLRLELDSDAAAMRAVLATLGLPADYVQALDAGTASARAGVALQHPAWFYPGGGWIGPGRLARAYLERAGALAQWHGSTRIARIEAVSHGSWRIVDLAGDTIASAPALVLANAADALRLLGAPDWPVQARRGQLSCLPASTLQRAGLAAPRLPIAGAGYLLPEHAAQVCFGATTQVGDPDPAVRDADHRTNLAQLERLLGCAVPVDLAEATGRTAWRCTSRDRLPLIGAMPDLAAAAGAGAASKRADPPRFISRLAGLFVFTALGSRGITWSALGAQVIASGVSGAPMPLEADLLDAIDPARFAVRTRRRG
jgi:tRNA 5-methylaminomethyl-2-thiouridine biosynthesis bifunctional protein